MGEIKFPNCRHGVPWHKCETCEHKTKIDVVAPKVGLTIVGSEVSEKKE